MSVAENLRVTWTEAGGIHKGIVVAQHFRDSGGDWKLLVAETDINGWFTGDLRSFSHQNVQVEPQQ